MFPKMGKTFPDEDGKLIDRLEYRAAISFALRHELGGSHRAIKTLVKWTGASDRTVKNWLSGAHGPSGKHLIAILKHSDQMMLALAHLTGRDELGMVSDLKKLRLVLARLIAAIDGTLGLDQ